MTAPPRDTPGVAAALRLSTPIADLPRELAPGVRTARVRLLSRLGIRTVSDLIRHVPLRYERESAEGGIDDLPMDGVGSARGTIVVTRSPGPPGGKSRFEATLEDHRARLKLVWFNAGYLKSRIHPGMTIRVTGKVKAFGGYPQMVNPSWEALTDGDAPVRDERLRPIYPATEDLASAVIEKLIAGVLPAALPLLEDPLPVEHVRALNMPALADAFRLLHQPAHEDDAASAHRRLAYNELLLLQLGIAIKRCYNRTRLEAPALRWSAAIDRHIRARFGFDLTSGQDTAVRDIAGDLQRSAPMNRLLQGDVGAGKTVVALYALLLAVAQRRQGAIMAPTQLLADQHYYSITRMLAGSNVRVALLTGGRSTAGSAERAALLADIAAGGVDLVVGTQALLTDKVKFADLAVVVVDEQHRFGVLQRAAFREPVKRGASAPAGEPKLHCPHYLVMTATPIPRTLSLTVFGDLDVSTIRGLPPGRTPIVTRVVAPDKADEVYRYVADRVAATQGRAYVVVPAIDAAGHETARQLKSVNEHARFLTDKYFTGKKVAAVHGRLKQQTRESIMDRFRRGEIDVLVATTVIEVGVDVPEATLMVIEHAERFGLAQLHQLRGRIGRGDHGRSLCVLIAEPVTEEAQKRMAAIAATNDGFKIAERDLEIRGMGDFFGTRQHGLPPLKVARIPEDMELLQQAKRDATRIIEGDPTLAAPDRRLLRKVLLQQYGDTLGLIDVG